MSLTVSLTHSHFAVSNHAVGQRLFQDIALKIVGLLRAFGIIWELANVFLISPLTQPPRSILPFFRRTFCNGVSLQLHSGRTGLGLKKQRREKKEERELEERGRAEQREQRTENRGQRAERERERES